MSASRGRAASGAMAGALAWFLARDLDLTSLVSFWGERAWLLPPAIAIGTACALTRLRIPFYAATGALAAVWLVVLTTPIDRWLLDGLVRRDPLRKADAILVLSTRMQSDGEPTSTQIARLLRGAELVSEGWSARLIISELPPPEAQQEPYARRLLGSLSVDAELIVLRSVRNTFDEGRETADVFKRNGWRTVMLATAPYHSRRGAAVLEGFGLDVISAPSIETRVDLESLDRAEERLMTFGALVHEHVGIWLYRRRGWIR